MIVSVSTECFPDLPLHEAIERLAELEFTAVEIDVHEGGHLEPAKVLADGEWALAQCSDLQRLRPVVPCFPPPRRRTFTIGLKPAPNWPKHLGL